VQVGKTKVFLRAGQLADLDAMRGEKLNSAARVIQRGVRTCLLRRRFLLMRAGAVKAQSIWRGNLQKPCILPCIVQFALAMHKATAKLLSVGRGEQEGQQ